MDLKKLEAVGEFIIIEKLEEGAADDGPIKVVNKSTPFFGRGRVVASDDLGIDEGDEIVYLIDNAIPLGLGAPENVVVAKLEDVVCLVEEDEEDEE